MTRYGMAIDLRRCIGCQACATACKFANNLPKDLSYNVVYTKADDDWNTLGTAVVRGALANDNAGGTFPNCTLNFLPMQCQHCEKPACLDVCPTGATAKDEETGIVSVDSELCIGCESCIKACPVSYTHLDVYKRQSANSATHRTRRFARRRKTCARAAKRLAACAAKKPPTGEKLPKRAGRARSAEVFAL